MPAPTTIPFVIESARLILRAVQLDDAPRINTAVHESINALRPWMPWANELPSLADTEAFGRQAQSEFQSRVGLTYQLRGRSDNRLPGMTGFHDIDWSVPRVEIGYWLRTTCGGRGYATEAVERLTKFAFDELGAQRVAITMDDLNQRSWRVAERAGFRLEGLLRNEARNPFGELRNTRVYAWWMDD
jgi:ribosomal-protein-serine acetyltransferase